MRISLIAALGHHRVLGKDNRLLWHIPDDLRRFKRLTLGHPCIMGRKTFDSIIATLGTPLPGRLNIVLSRQGFEPQENVALAPTIEAALEIARTGGTDEVFVVGGAQVYTQTLPLADALYLTLIDDTAEGDAYFPPYEEVFTHIISEEQREHGELHYTWLTLERPRSSQQDESDTERHKRERSDLDH
jgi:dihydrofolate reductase